MVALTLPSKNSGVCIARKSTQGNPLGPKKRTECIYFLTKMHIVRIFYPIKSFVMVRLNNAWRAMAGRQKSTKRTDEQNRNHFLQIGRNVPEKENSMLSDIYNVRTGYKPQHVNVHRHALFSCAIQRFLVRLRGLFAKQG